MTVTWLALCMIGAFVLVAAFFGTQRELAWARLALRAMYGEPAAG